MSLVTGFDPSANINISQSLFSAQQGRLENVQGALEGATGLSSATEFPSILDQKQIIEEYRNPQTPEQEKLRDATDEFVSLMFGALLKAMRKTVPKTGLLDGGHAEEVFQDFLDVEYSKAAVTQADMPLAHQLYEQMSRSVR